MTNPTQPTAELLAEVHAALAAATEGPWEARAGIQVEPWIGKVDVVDGHRLTVGRAMSPADAVIIAAARSWLPELADRLERAERHGDQLDSYVGRINEILRDRGGVPVGDDAIVGLAKLCDRLERAEAAIDVAIRLADAAETTGRALEGRVRELEAELTLQRIAGGGA